MSPVAGGGETAREESAWTVDSTREWIADTHMLRDRIDNWRDRLHDEREDHRREIGILRELMYEQRFKAQEQAVLVAQKASDEKFAGFPEQYARLGETNAKITTLERTINDLVAASQVRTGTESGVATQRVEVAAAQEQRRLSQGTRLALAALAFTLLNTVLPWLLSR